MNPATVPFEIREVRLADAPALTHLFGELGYPAAAGQVEGRLRVMLASGELVLVAVQRGVPIGVVTVHVMPVLHRPTAVGRLSALIVTEDARGAGVGRALVGAAERALAARGCALVEVTSNQRRTDAHAFYERLGYERTSLRFKKALTPAS